MHSNLSRRKFITARRYPRTVSVEVGITDNGGLMAPFRDRAVHPPTRTPFRKLCPNMTQSTIAFIGGGNMATSLIGGLVARGTPGESIWVTDAEPEKLTALHGRFGVRTTGDNADAVGRAETVVLAVKPQNMSEVVSEVSASARAHQPLVVSIAAGVRIEHIRGWLDYEAAIVRTMPNTPALVGAGATALFANERVSPEQKDRAETVLRAVGLTLWVDDEGLLDTVTALSGSGPAYYFLLMETMEDVATGLGLDRETARRLTLQTAFGAAKIALEGEEPPATLRTRVTSPGGTTERALNILRDGGFADLFEAALTGARDRSIELGDDFGPRCDE